MLPEINIAVFFYIILTGYMTMWAFRKSANWKDKLDQFEALVFSSFWGLFILLVVSILIKFSPQHGIEVSHNAFDNPFAFGLLFSIFGIIVGFCSGLVFGWCWKNFLKNN